MSNINYVSINENFPVAGEDNDTQVFRDNFDTIKTSLRVAKEELEVLQDADAGAALKGQDNDFNNTVISRALFQETADKKLQGGIIGGDTTQLTIDFQEGNYQIFKIASTPTNSATLLNSSISGTTLTVGSVSSGAIVPGMKLIGTGIDNNNSPCYIVSGAGNTWTVSKAQSVSGITINAALRILPISFDNFPQNSNPLQPLAVGKVTLELTTDGENVSLNVISSNGTAIRTNGFPNGQTSSNILVSSANAPLILEVWRHNQDNIFIKYVGQFN